MKKSTYVTNETFKAFTDGTFKEFKDTVVLKFLKTDERLDRIEASMATKQDINRVLDRLDTYYGKYRGIDLEQAAQAHQIKELRETSTQHEKRISTLEQNQ